MSQQLDINRFASAFADSVHSATQNGEYDLFMGLCHTVFHGIYRSPAVMFGEVLTMNEAQVQEVALRVAHQQAEEARNREAEVAAQ